MFPSVVNKKEFKRNKKPLNQWPTRPDLYHRD